MTEAAILPFDPCRLIDDAPMSRLQIVAVGMTILLNGLDGFDVLSISFAAPGIAHDWGITRAALGVVLSMELLGMAAGSVLLGGLADRVGRRPMLLGCLVVMACGMAMAARSSSVADLCVWRVTTGLGIGGILAATNATVAEFSNARRRGLSQALMVIGYPLGAVIGGAFVGELLKAGDWRVVFAFGAAMTAAMIPLTWLFVPETVAFLNRRRPAGALPRINRTLARMKLGPVAALPDQAGRHRRAAVGDLLKPPFIGLAALLVAAYFSHMISFYFLLKWAPKIVADMGFAASAGAGVLVWTNVGGAVGGALFGLLTPRFTLKSLTIATLVASSAMVIVFGRGQESLVQLQLAAACTGFFSNAAVVGVYTLLAQSFPAELRATGTGLVVGLGRGGAALSPVLVGLMFQAGQSLQSVSLVMALGSAMAAIALFFLPTLARGAPSPEVALR